MRLASKQVIEGICDLLNQTKEPEIINHTIKACTYISLNYDFIKQSEFSLPILKELLHLLDKVENKQDVYNIILSIKNILKGAKTNKMFFYDNGGTAKF